MLTKEDNFLQIGKLKLPQMREPRKLTIWPVWKPLGAVP